MSYYDRPHADYGAPPESPRRCPTCKYGTAPSEVLDQHEQHLEDARRKAQEARRKSEVMAKMMDLAAISNAGMKGLPKAPRVPKREQDIYDALSAAFRAGEIFSFSFDDGWQVWETEADWLATKRHERFAVGVPARKPNTYVPDPQAAAAGHGPWTATPANVRHRLGIGATEKKLTKAQLVASLRKMADRLPPEALELLEAA